jgi:diacylglycerol kinase (ATP)
VLSNYTGWIEVAGFVTLVVLLVGTVIVLAGGSGVRTEESTVDAGNRRRRGRTRPPRAHFRPADEASPVVTPRKRAAIVVNPTKFDDVAAVRQRVGELCDEAGWEEPLWLETTAQDTGFGQAQQALAADVDLVCALGGDGTVRCVASALVGTDTPLGLLPRGTGNLLARNLGVPVDDLDEALVVALTGRNKRVDVGRLLVNASGEHEHPDEHVFLVMAGLGFDAAIMDGAPERLKARVGWLAYGVSGVKNLKGTQFRARVTVDDDAEFTRRARTVVIGNCGKLTGGLVLLPEAEVTDGWLDAVILSPNGLPGWVAVAARVLSRRARGSERVDHRRMKQISVRINRPEAVQLDGDTIGRARAISARVDPLALIVRV